MPKPRTVKRFGWIPDIPDHRDLLYSSPPTFTTLPPSVDLRVNMQFPVLQQAELGSCTANAIAVGMRYNQIKQGVPDFTPSRLFIYWNERYILGTVDQDSGAMLRDGIKTVAKDGAPPEDMWPYNIAKFREKPPKDVFVEAEKHQIVLYQRIVRDLSQMKACLATGFPFVFGFTVYPHFESPEVARTGIVPLPSSSDEVSGGHAVIAVGYDDEKQLFCFRNSWGSGWGDKGYGYLPYSYLTQRSLSNDFWTMRLIEG